MPYLLKNIRPLQDFENRHHDQIQKFCRTIIIFGNISMMFWQTVSLIMAKDLITIYLNSAFMLISFLIWYLVYRSYKKNAHMATTVYPAYIIFVIRQLLRLADFDNRRSQYSPEIWCGNVIFTTFSYTFYMTVFMFSFYKIKGSYLMFLIILTIA